MGIRKSRAFTMQECITAIQNIPKRHLRIYGAITLYLATRSGEILPYRHYHYEYERNYDGKVIKAIAKDGSKYPSKRKVISKFDSPGIEVMSIKTFDNYIEFILPVFKCKQQTFDVGYIYKKNNPFFEDIKAFIIERQTLRQLLKKPVYLFEAKGDVETYFNSFKKSFARALKKQLPEAKVHSLRKSMATHAAIISGGDIFFVKGVTRHRKLETLNEYVAPIRLKQQMEKYLGVEEK